MEFAEQQGFSLSELIDTLWNVNWENFVTLLHLCTELIDTLWNVNIFPLDMPILFANSN